MAFINQITDRLANQMTGDGAACETMFRQQRPLLFYISGLGESAAHLEMIAPTSEFHTVVTHLSYQGQQFRQGEIGPLAGEKCDSSWHKSQDSV